VDVFVALRKPTGAAEAFLVNVASPKPAPVWYEKTYYPISSGTCSGDGSSLTRFSKRRLFL
jgi:hypothetical protein